MFSHLKNIILITNQQLTLHLNNLHIIYKDFDIFCSAKNYILGN